EALLDARRVDLDGEAADARHRRRERLRAPHPAEPRGEDPRLAGLPGARGVRLPRGDERLEGALEDPLRADVDPGAGRHLTEHDEALLLELAEDLPGRPLADQVRVRDEDPRRVGMRLEAADGLARLDEERLVVPELGELSQDDVEAVPGTS